MDNYLKHPKPPAAAVDTYAIGKAEHGAGRSVQDAYYAGVEHALQNGAQPDDTTTISQAGNNAQDGWRDADGCED